MRFISPKILCFASLLIISVLLTAIDLQNLTLGTAKGLILYTVPGNILFAQFIAIIIGLILTISVPRFRSSLKIWAAALLIFVLVVYFFWAYEYLAQPNNYKEAAESIHYFCISGELYINFVDNALMCGLTNLPLAQSANQSFGFISLAVIEFVFLALVAGANRWIGKPKKLDL